ncbi:hypothetical protein [Streptomyces sp. cmx-4-25]
MAELAGYARFRDAMERAHPTLAESPLTESAPHEREPAAAATAVTSSSSG